MQVALPIAQIIISFLLIVSILLQQRGAGLGGVFGGGGSNYHTKRGFEKIIFTSTIVLSVLFIIITFLGLL